jgi:YgiT-type zinc finger domain-containing protein
MKCVFCEGEMIESRKRVERRTNQGELVIIDNVPVLICNGCQEVFYDDKVLDKIDEIVRLRDNAPKIPVPLLDYNSAFSSEVCF